jgi:CRP-like cAMP-binding protein
MELASPQTRPDGSDKQQKAKEPRPLVEIALDLVTIFASLTASERASIAANLSQHFYDQDDILAEPGKLMSCLCIVASGVISCARRDGKSGSEFMRLGPGDHFGEIGLLTGAPGAATITALTPVIVYELAKADLAPILEARPEVSQELSRALARRQAAGRSTAIAETDETVPTHRLTTWFSDRIHRLYADTSDT